MKVILLRDVARLGKRHSLVTVPDGYALNKLIPQSLALPATPENVKRVENRARGLAAETASDAAALTATLQAVATEPLVIKAEANAQQHLFKAIKAPDIVTAATARGLWLKDTILTVPPIKELGTYTIPVHDGAITGVVTISVISNK